MHMTETRQSFARSLTAYAVSEVAAKASRLLVVVAVARAMDLSAIGVAAGALAAADILKALTENGVGQRIIAAPEARLAATVRGAHRIFWVWCTGIFALQVAVGAIGYALWGDALFFALLVILGAEYLFMPAGLVQCALAMRAGRMRETAAIAGGQVVGANMLSALLVLAMPGPLALVLPRLLAAPIWLIAMRRLHPWSPDRAVAPEPLLPFVQFGAPVLGVELVKAGRLQIDKLIVGALMGPEALGLYFMAFNAGLGLATSFAQAFSIALYPHLCAARDRAAALRRALMGSVALIAPVVVLQALAAPLYVPLLLGARWSGTEGIVSILCLAAIPNMVWSAAAQWLRAEGRPQIELGLTLVLAAALAANTALMAPFGLHAVAWGYLAVAVLVQIGAVLPTLMPLMRSQSPRIA